jgi:hypothetical protein
MSRSDLEVIDNKVIPILVLCFLSHAQFEAIHKAIDYSQWTYKNLMQTYTDL